MQNSRSRFGVIAAAVLLLAGLALFFALRLQAQAAQDKPTAAPIVMAVPVKTALPLRLTVADTSQAVGSLLADESALISAEIGGKVRGVHFMEGQPVKAGALLLQLDAEEYRATAEQSQAQAALDKLSLMRIDAVRRRDLASQQALDEAKARWQQSQAVARRDQLHLAKTDIRAPFAGVAGLRLVSPGDYVSPGQALVNLEALDVLKLDFALPEHYAAKVAQGQKITFQVDAYPNETFAGELYAVDPRLDEQSRSLKLRARVANARQRLKPGMFARLVLQLGAERQVLSVPEHAVIGVGSRQYVYRVVGDKAVLSLVTSGLHQNAMVEISSGLAAEDTVVVEGQMKLRDGDAVRIIR
ncbi:MAG: efflux RND transporter periplasmic adaptor subunit [Methylococcaceae bacterium]|nr:MAG: efflux RND transporter periplasmic adaptor subunit [Methylococcaceae bacterium]